MYKVIFNNDEKNYEEFESLEKAEKFAKRYANTEIERGENKMKYYKIYTKDEQNRDTIRLLETEKSLSEIQKKFGKCEELFDTEFVEMKEHVKMLEEDFDKDWNEFMSDISEQKPKMKLT